MALPRMPDLCPDVPLGISNEWSMWTQSLGDGYETRELTGINPLKQAWNVSYSNRRWTDIQALEAFLKSVKNNAFTFYDPGDEVGYPVFCDGWTKSLEGRLKGGGFYGSLTATFRIAYGYK
jgi:phage-related protein